MASPPRLCATRRPTKAVTPLASSESRPSSLAASTRRADRTCRAAGRDRRAVPTCRCGVKRSYPAGRRLARRGQVEKPRSVRSNKELMIAVNQRAARRSTVGKRPSAQRSLRWYHMKFASIMTDMDIHQTWTSGSAAEQQPIGRGRQTQVYLASPAPVPALFSALIDGVRGRSGKLTSPAEASGLITDALRVQAMMVS